MILNNKHKHNIFILFIILLISLYHYLLQNGIEKITSSIYFPYNNVKRPLQPCNNSFSKSVSCIGMPSNHAETATISCCLLYNYNYIPFWICILVILLVCFQRVITHMHTIFQVIIGVIIGLIYSYIYISLNMSTISFFSVFCIGLILVSLIVYKIDKQVNGLVPDWVDKSMMESIHKKQNVPFYLKTLSIYTNAVYQYRTFINWTDLEKYLDIIVERIKKSDIKYDAVVGIKTGGAIISDYVSKKLQLPNYKVKLSRIEYNCNKKPINIFNDVLQKQVLGNFGKYTVCEPIDQDLSDKNIILIDEMVSTGNTMSETINYLKRDKHVNHIYPTCISFSREKFKQNFNVNYVIPKLVFVWPWGYDN